MTQETVSALKQLLAVFRQCLQNGDLLVAISAEAKRVEERP